MSFLMEFDRGKLVLVNYDWDLGHIVDLLRNVTMSRLMFWTNGLIYSGSDIAASDGCNSAFVLLSMRKHLSCAFYRRKYFQTTFSIASRGTSINSQFQLPS